jgi:hypothetical protein
MMQLARGMNCLRIGSSRGLFQSIRDKTCGVILMAMGANLVAATASSIKASLCVILRSRGFVDGPSSSGSASERNLYSLCLSVTVLRT